MSKPFPVPPHFKPSTPVDTPMPSASPPSLPPVGHERTATGTSSQATGTPFDVPKTEDYDPRLNDEETMTILKEYLLPVHFKDPRVIKFILLYITSRNADESAREAGFGNKSGGYWRSRPEIHAAIEALTAKAVMKYGYDAMEVMERVKDIAFVDPIEFQNPDGTFKTHLSEISPRARAAIKKFRAKNLFGVDANGMQIVIGQLIDVELNDKLKGLEHLGTEKNILKKTTVVQHDVTSNMSSFLLDSGRRADERKQLMAREVGSETERTGESGHSDDSGRDGSRVHITERGGQDFGGTTIHDIEVVSGQEDDTSGG